MAHIIIEKASDDLRATRSTTLYVLAACLVIFAFNWKYFYNMATGPYSLGRVDLSNPGAVQYVEADAPFLKVGSKNLALGKDGAVDTGAELGSYLVCPVGTRMLLVYVDSDFEGDHVSGRLTDIPDDFKEQAAETPALYPVMLDGYVNYALSPNLFLLVAMVAFVVSLILLVGQLIRGPNPEKHPYIRRLAKSGISPMTVVRGIEADMAADTTFWDDDPIFCSERWIVFLHNGLKIYPRSEFIGYGVEAKEGAEHLEVYIRGNASADTILLGRSRLKSSLAVLKERLPHKFIEDVKAYNKLWNAKNPPAPSAANGA
ncbi:hypothetical protein [Cerasicoccus arenae]|uniref:Uncharacterized protein n=1 Tax=Cerasicoccus arenae TaxID=424488 RepID=A0A8J3DBI0_9BACT|nr:hypothetical protein [Cerasicoccus arenae]MBK1859215.1 hypothetical protein [Cerasicoccus arenae]GHC01345.1 hypothetical protein GCM10007047_17250 [Cerasicoccus arenae]